MGLQRTVAVVHEQGEAGSEDEIVPPVSLVARLPAIPSILSAFTVRVSGAIKSDLDPAPAAANSFLVFF